MAERTIATVLREIDQIKRADIPQHLKDKFIRQKQAELAAIADALPGEPPPKTPK